MVLGIGPVLGDGDAGSAITSDGKWAPWGYTEGRYYFSKDKYSTLMRDAYHVNRPSPPVAVLTGPDTASAAEAVLISFRGRPHTRTFGEPTYGLPTLNTINILSDGAELAVTDVKEADRTGRVYGYNEKIQPDEYMPSVGSIQDQGSSSDPVLVAALAWLHTQPPCTR